MRCNMTFLVMPCHCPDGITSCYQQCQGTTIFLTSRQSKWGATFLVMWHNCHCHLHHMMPMVLVSHDTIAINISVIWYSIINGNITFLGQDDKSEVQYDITGHKMPFALDDVMQKHCQWHHCTCWVRMIKMKYKMTFW